MINKVLLAVDDSPAALAAARLAVTLCAGWGATLRVVTVVMDHMVTEHLMTEHLMTEHLMTEHLMTEHLRPSDVAASGAAASTGTQLRREQTADTMLRYVAQLAGAAAVPVQTALIDGNAAPCILEQARAFAADLIVVGRSALPGAGQPYVGSQTRHVLEFADGPVLVVPPPRRAS
jgi:nucleotide-binding universal stress UspA family protein